MTAALQKESNVNKLEKRYCAALRQYIKDDTRKKPAAALQLGLDAVNLRLDVLELAVIHERVLIEEALSTKTMRARQRILRRAAKFFAEVIVPIEATHRTALADNATLQRLNRALEERTRKISVSQKKLKAEIARRKTVEQNLRKSERQSNQLLQQSRQLQDDLQRLSRGILSAQEEERKRISRELHDLVAQTLTAINVHLENLKREAAQNARGMKKNIARTQKLVERSVDKVHRFARELRPAVLDDLGLIPALQSLVEYLAKESGFRVKMTASADVQKLTNERRTVLYRVAQEALTNIARHARAGHVSLDIRKKSNAVHMQIHDDGCAFDVEQLLNARKSRRMGLLGMRERVEMVGGIFEIESSPGQGTTVTARIPFRNRLRKNRSK